MFTKISHPTVNDVNVYLSTQKGGGKKGGGGGGGRGEEGRWGGGGRGERGGRGSLTERKHFTHTFFVWKIKW